MLTEKQLDPQNGGHKKKKNAKTVRKRKTGRRVGNVFVYVSDLHNIFLYIFTRYYTNSSVKQ